MEQHDILKVRMRRTHQQIDELLSQYEQSGCSVGEFCSMKGLNPRSLHKWLSRRKAAGADNVVTSGFSKVILQASPTVVLFAEVGSIRLYQPVSAAYLKELAR